MRGGCRFVRKIFELGSTARILVEGEMERLNGGEVLVA